MRIHQLGMAAKANDHYVDCAPLDYRRAFLCSWFLFAARI